MSYVLAQLRRLTRPQPGWYALVAAVGLAVLGIAAMQTVHPDFAAIQRGRWLPIAVAAMAVCLLPSPRVLAAASYAAFGVAVLLLVYVIIPGAPRVPRINGATSWIDLGVMSFQPSEMAKVAFVMALAFYLRRRDSYRRLLGLLVPFGFMFVPVVLILKEPDLGSALLLPPTLFVMMIAAGAKLRHLGALAGIAAVLVAGNVLLVVYQDDLPDSAQVLAPHQRARIESIVNYWRGEDQQTQDIGYHADKAITAVASGGAWGYGQARSRTILEFNHLPYDHNDSIYAVIVNRWGLAGAVATVGLYVVLLVSCLLVAARSKDPFARLCCVGFSGLIFTQSTINIGMMIGLFPITGITLPFISYGGTSLLFTFVMVGLVVNFASRRPRPMARPSFEFDVEANRDRAADRLRRPAFGR